jgi:hypothetical protein
MRRVLVEPLAEAVARWCLVHPRVGAFHHQRLSTAVPQARGVAASSAAASPSAALTEQSPTTTTTAATRLYSASPFWTLCGVVAIGISAAAVGQRAACADRRAERAELRNAAAEAYAAERRGAEAAGRQLAAVEAAARRELEEGGGDGARRRPWRVVSEELWAAMSDRGEEEGR